MAWPTRSQEGYLAVKEGIVRNLFERKTMKKRSKEQAAKLDIEITVPDEKLREYVNDIFRKELRVLAYNTFIRAKSSSKAILAYYNFINAYNLYQKGEYSNGNICCLAFDRAKDLLK